MKRLTQRSRKVSKLSRIFNCHDSFVLLVESELEVQSSSRLTALHSSLQQEAEKIRKWKNVTELELKHKVKILGSMQNNILQIHVPG